MLNGMLQTTVGTCVHVQVWTCTGIDQGPQLPRHRGSSARQRGGWREEGREGGGHEGGQGVGCSVHIPAHSTAHSTAVPPAEVLVPCHLMDRMLWAQCTVHYNGTIHMYTACLYTCTCTLHWHSHTPCGMYVHVHVHHMHVMMSAALGGSRGILQPQSSPHTHT